MLFHQLAHRIRPWVGAAALALVAGCAAVGPNYSAPEPSAPKSWQGAVAAKVAVTEKTPSDVATWWRGFNDPVLTDFVEQAMKTSLDVRTALAKLREARAQRALAGAELFPTVTASASGNQTKASGDSGNGAVLELFSAGIDAGWEPDVFGSLRRAQEAAQADLEASEAGLHDVQVSLAAEVAINYVELRAYQARLAIARFNVDTQSETLDLTRWRAQAGLTSVLDVEQARANLEQTRAQIPELETAASESEHRLEVLLGRQPGTLKARTSHPDAIPELPERIAMSIPADTLRQRPDVRVAERELAAATARIGEAQAQAYPSFELGGSIGLEALTLGALAGGNALTHGVLGSVAAPIFNAGRVRDQVEIQNAQQEQALVNYEAVVLNALEEVENALAALANNRTRRQTLRKAVSAARSAAQLARYRYNAGLVDFQTVLDSERTLLTLEDDLTTSKADGITALIRLYKALGGGWSPTSGNVSAKARAKTPPTNASKARDAT
jgi:NodT family efflux transporter outer membrane factor (OMF) lipoprotein